MKNYLHIRLIRDDGQQNLILNIINALRRYGIHARGDARVIEDSFAISFVPPAHVLGLLPRIATVLDCPLVLVEAASTPPPPRRWLVTKDSITPIHHND